MNEKTYYKIHIASNIILLIVVLGLIFLIYNIWRIGDIDSFLFTGDPFLTGAKQVSKKFNGETLCSCVIKTNNIIQGLEPLKREYYFTFNKTGYLISQEDYMPKANEFNYTDFQNFIIKNQGANR